MLEDDCCNVSDKSALHIFSPPFSGFADLQHAHHIYLGIHRVYQRHPKIQKKQLFVLTKSQVFWGMKNLLLSRFFGLPNQWSFFILIFAAKCWLVLQAMSCFFWRQQWKVCTSGSFRRCREALHWLGLGGFTVGVWLKKPKGITDFCLFVYCIFSFSSRVFFGI